MAWDNDGFGGRDAVREGVGMQANGELGTSTEIHVRPLSQSCALDRSASLVGRRPPRVRHRL